VQYPLSIILDQIPLLIYEKALEIDSSVHKISQLISLGFKKWAGIFTVWVVKLAKYLPWAEVIFFKAERSWQLTFNKIWEHYSCSIDVRNDLSKLIQKVALFGNWLVFQINKIATVCNIDYFQSIRITLDLPKNLVFVKHSFARIRQNDLNGVNFFLSRLWDFGSLMLNTIASRNSAQINNRICLELYKLF